MAAFVTVFFIAVLARPATCAAVPCHRGENASCAAEQDQTSLLQVTQSMKKGDERATEATHESQSIDSPDVAPATYTPDPFDNVKLVETSTGLYTGKGLQLLHGRAGKGIKPGKCKEEDQTEDGLATPVCPGDAMQQQKCGEWVTWNLGEYQWLESTTPSRDRHGNFAYAVASMCNVKKKKGKFVPNPTCAPSFAPWAPTGANIAPWDWMDVLKIYTTKPADDAIKQVSRVAQVQGFTGFGSKLTSDGRMLFVADLLRGIIKGIDFGEGEERGVGPGRVSMSMYNVPQPNDIALIEQGGGLNGGTIDIISCGGSKHLWSQTGELEASLHTAIWRVQVWGRQGRSPSSWLPDKTGTRCGVSGRAGSGCDFEQMVRRRELFLKHLRTCAGVGVDYSHVTADHPVPNVWGSLLYSFAVVDLSGERAGDEWWLEEKKPPSAFDVTDRRFYGEFGCQIPQSYVSQTRRHLITGFRKNDKNFALMDNVIMLDENTMISPFYTDCGHNTLSHYAAQCVAYDGTLGAVEKGGKTTKKDIDYNVIAFEKVCLNEFKMSKQGLSKDIKAIAEIFAFPLPEEIIDKDAFNGRITHIQNVGPDLLVTNYLYSKSLIFRNAVKHITDSCDPELVARRLAAGKRRGRSGQRTTIKRGGGFKLGTPNNWL